MYLDMDSKYFETNDPEKEVMEWKKKAELYLNETCEYCNEKMIVIGSKHIHACKHDLINTDKDKY